MEDVSTDITPELDEEASSSGGVRLLLDHIAKLRASLRDAKLQHADEVRELQSQLDQLQAEFDKEREEVKVQHQKEVEEARQLNDSSSKRVQELENSLTEAEEERDYLKESLQEAQEDIEAGKRLQASHEEAIAAERKQADKIKDSFEGTRAKLKELLNEKVSLKKKAAAAEPLIQENEDLQATVDDLTSELEEMMNARDKVAQELDDALNSSTAVRCKELEEENIRLSALAEEKVSVADEAEKRAETAEQQAFESRRKLLDLYADGESKTILRGQVDELEQFLAAKTAEVESLEQQLVEAQKKYDEMEHKLLYSSERESLRRSLSALAERRSLGDSDG